MSRSVKLPADFLLDKSITLNMIRVYTALALFPEKEGARSPTRQQLADLTGLPMNHISQATARLVDAGWLTKTGKGGQKSPTAYRFRTPDPESKSTRTDSVRVHTNQDIEIIEESPEHTEQLTCTDLVTVTESITVTESVRVQESQQYDLPKEIEVLTVQDKKPSKAKVFKPVPPDLREIPLPDWLPRDQWRRWIDYRQHTKKKPMSVDGAQTLIKQLGIAWSNGWAPEQLFDTAIAGDHQGCFWNQHRAPNPYPQPQRGVHHNGYTPPASKPGAFQQSQARIRDFLNQSKRPAAAGAHADQSDRQPLEGEFIRVAG